MSLVMVENAAFGYDHQDVFQNISFNVKKGEIICFFGPNGCGKSTLLECILGILKVKKGSISLMGKNISEIRYCDVAKSIAYVPQNHEKKFPYRVLDIVLMGRAPYTGLFSSPSEEDFNIAEQALEMVGIKKYKDKVYTQLSGGETQLVLLARALAQKTPVIIMDEPTAHLDFKHELIVQETIVQLVKESEISIIMATHFPNQAFYFENNCVTTSVALMNNKKFMTMGSPSQVLTEENMRSTFNVKAKLLSCAVNGNEELKQIVPLNVVS